jgi:hypothetical protein
MFETQAPAPERISRLVMLTKSRGGVTELERVGKSRSSGDVYVIRYHREAKNAARIFEGGSWIGFRYRDANWSFVKPADS